MEIKNYLDQLDVFIQLDLSSQTDYTLNYNWYVSERKNPLFIIMEYEFISAVKKAFNKLPYNIKYLLHEYIIEEKNLVNFAVKHNFQLLELSEILEKSILLLKTYFLQYLNNEIY